jgi:predicted dehydrogenase
VPPRRDPVRLGIIGTGLALERLHWPALRQMPERFRVVAFANDTREPAEKFAAEAGLSMDGYTADYHELLRRDDVEAVAVLTPIPLLYAVTRAALEAGKHVLSEKPAGSNLEQGRDFLALAEQFPDRKVLVAENFFYRDDLRLARSLLDEGAIGRVHLMSWRVVFHLVPREGTFSSTPWRHAPLYRGGPHLDAGVHHIAQIRVVCGDVADLQGYLQYANPTHGGPSDLVLNMHFASHAIGSYVGAHLAIPSPGESNEMRVYGDDGVLTAVGGPRGPRTVRVHRPDGSIEEHAIESDNGYYNEWLNFHDALVHDEPIVGTILQSYHNLLLVMRALDSAEEHRLVDVDVPGGISEHGVPLWRPRGAKGLFDGLPCKVERTK